jgi:hypothetical protein
MNNNKVIVMCAAKNDFLLFYNINI